MSLTVPGNGDQESAQEWYRRSIREREESKLGFRPSAGSAAGAWYARTKLESEGRTRHAMEYPAFEPSRAVRIMKLDGKIGQRADTSFLDANLELLEREVLTKDFDFSRFADESPTVNQWIGEGYALLGLGPDKVREFWDVEKLIRRKRTQWPLPKEFIDRVGLLLSQEEFTTDPRHTRARVGGFGFAPPLATISVEESARIEALPEEERARAKEEALLADFERRRPQFVEAVTQRIRDQESLIAGDDKLGTGEEFARKSAEDPLWFLPVLGGWAKIPKYERFMRAAEAMREGTASDLDRFILWQAARVEEAMSRRGLGFVTKIASIVAEMPAFVGEFALGGAGAAKVIGKKSLQAGAESIIRTAMRKAARFGAGTVIQTGIAMPPEMIADTMRLIAEGKPLLEAIPKAILSAWSEIASERAGVLFTRVLDSPLHKALFGWWLGKNPGGSYLTYQKALRAGGFHGPIPEWSEERLGNFIRALGGVEPFEWPSLEDSAAELLAFTVPSIGGAALSRIGARRPPEVSDPAKFRAIGDAVRESGLAETAPQRLEEIQRNAEAAGASAFAYMGTEPFEDYAKKQNTTPSALAQGLFGAASVYEDAAARGEDMQIPMTEYLTKVSATEHNNPLSEHLREKPLEVVTAEAQEFLQTREEEEKRTQLIERQVLEEIYKPERQQEIVDQAAEEAQEQMKGELQVLEETDAIALVQRSLSDKVVWPDPARPGKNVEELSKSKIPKHLIATPSRRLKGAAAQKAAGMDEVADLLGLGSSSEAVQAIERAAEKRKDLRNRLKQRIAPEWVIEAVMNRVFAGEVERRKAEPPPSEALPVGALRGQALAPKEERPVGALLEPPAGEALPVGALREQAKAPRGPALPLGAVAGEAVPIPAGALAPAAAAPRAADEMLVQIARSFTEKARKAGLSIREADVNAALHRARIRIRALIRGESPLSITGREQLEIRKVKEIPAEEPALEKRKGKVVAGRTLVLSDERIAIELSRHRNLSTLLHERLGHVSLIEFGRDVALVESVPVENRTAVQRVFLEDMAKVLKFLGVETWDQLTTVGKEKGSAEYRRAVEAHEKWATAVEQYVMEGRSPSKDLRTALARAFEWLVRIYKRALSLDVEVTPEIREVMDRMLATQEEIDAVYEEMGVRPMFDAAQRARMSETKAARMVRALTEAKESAVSDLLPPMMEAIRRRQTREWREKRGQIREGVLRELRQLPVYQALLALEKGEGAEGETLPDAENWKLSAKLVASQFGSDRLKELPKGVLHAKADKGMHPEAAAEQFGFSSADALLSALENSVPIDRVVDRIADERMKAGGPEILEGDALHEAALEAVHSEKQEALARLELEHLLTGNFGVAKDILKRLSRRVPPDAELRRWADAQIARKEYRGIVPNLHARAEARHAKRALDLFFRGDVVGAIQAKLDQITEIALYRAAIRARKMVESDVDYLKQFDGRPVREALGFAGKSYLDSSDAVMESIDLRPISERDLLKRQGLRKWYDDQVREGARPVLPEGVLAEGFRKSWKEMSPEELHRIRLGMQNLLHLARTKDKLKTIAEKREFDKTKEEVAASVGDAFRGRPPKVEPAGEESRSEGIFRRIASWWQDIKKFSTFLQELDGFKMGVMTRLLGFTLNEVQNTEFQRLKDTAGKLRAILSVYSAKEKKEMHERFEVPELGTSLSRWDLIGILMHWGNGENRQAVMDGYGWTREQVESAFKGLDARDTQTAEKLWELVDEFWPEIEQLSREIDGIPAERVEAEAFEIEITGGKRVRLRGGYWPLRHKPDPSKPHGSIQELAQEMIEGKLWRATTRHSHRETRVGSGGRAPRFEIGLVDEHIRDVIHDITHYRWVLDANKLLRDPDMQKLIRSAIGRHAHEEMLSLVNAVAANNRQTVGALGLAVEWMVNNTRSAVLAWNASTILKQYLGLTVAADALGETWLLRGVMSAFSGSIEGMGAVEAMIEENLFMRNRKKSQSRETLEVFSDFKATDVKGPIRQMASKLENWGFWPIVMTQWHVDKVIFLGAVQKYAEELKLADARSAEERAKILKEIENRAEQHVRDTQGSGLLGDMPAALRERGVMRAFTLYKTFALSALNRYVLRFEEAAARPSPETIFRAGLAFVRIYLIPATVWLAVKSLLQGDGSDDDKEKRWLKILKEAGIDSVSDVFWAIPLFGDGMQTAIDTFQGKPFDYDGPQGLAMIAEFVRLGGQIGQGELDGAFVRSLGRFVGYSTGLPSRQVDAMIRGFLRFREGEAAPGAIFLGPPPRGR